MAKISILIAAYNKSAYIAQTLESAVAQTLHDIEIICVDDCSTDNTPAVIQRFAANDSRIKSLRHEQNLGLFETRRTGVNAATGEYVVFLDGDDYLAPDACAQLYNAVCQNPVDVLHFEASAFTDIPVFVSTERLEQIQRTLTPYSTPLTDCSLVQMCFVDNRFDCTLCNKLFPLSLVSQVYQALPAVHLSVGADILVFFRICLHAATYAPLHQTLYFYRVGKGLRTQCHELLTDKQISAYAEAYQAYTILKDSCDSACVANGETLLKKVRDLLVKDILKAFFFYTHDTHKPAFLAQMVKYYPLQDFLADVVCACKDPAFDLKLSEAASKLRGLPCKPNRTIKTVGTYYVRMYNGGVERVISLLAPIWQHEGYQVVLFTEETPHPNDYPLPDTIRRVVLPHTENILDRFHMWQKLLKEHSIDVVVYHAWVSKYMTLDTLACKAADISLIMHTHGQACSPFGPGRRESPSPRSEYALSDVVVALSETDTAWWSALGFCSMRTMNPLTYDARHIPQASLNSKTVLWVGRLGQSSPEKRFGEALSIAELVREQVPDFCLQVVGNCETDEEWQAIVQEIQQRGLEQTVLLEGYQTDVAPYYLGACALLGTSEQEGCCMAHNEAHAFGLPLVAYELPNSDLLRKGKGVIVVPQGDRYQAAEQLIKLLNDDTYRHEMGNAARNSALEMSAIDLGAHWKKYLPWHSNPALLLSH